MTEYSGKDLSEIGAMWLDRIQQAEKREEKWIKEAEDAESAYLAGHGDNERGTVPDWNILHSNVETIVPSVYNSTPVPDIRPRHSARDDLSRMVSDAYERAIAMQIDDDKLDGVVEAVAQDTFVAGRGVMRLRFDADLEDIVEVVTDPVTGEEVEQDAGQRVVNQRVLYEPVAWRDYREGPAKKWSDVPWVAFRHFISQKELERIRDEDMWSKQSEGRKDAESEEKDVDVWEIWCRESGQVYFIAETGKVVLSIEEDPLGLPQFFPMPQPIQLITATNSRTPVCPYSIYKKQAEELNRVTKRIQGILAGIKIRGGVAAGAEAIEEIARAGDNELVPIADVEALVAAGGLDKAVMWWPVDQAIVVLRELYAAREQIKQSIYEITGISDIIRGQGMASETATAQKIKTEWGSLRIKKFQRLVERMVRDTFVLSAEIMARHFGPEGVARAAGMPLDQNLQMALDAGLDHYRIDVESNSTVRADTTMRREEMARFLEGTAQFFQVMAPLAAQAPQSAGVIAEIYGSFTAQFNLGKTAEDAISQLIDLARQQGQQPQQNPGERVAQMEAQAKAQEAQLRAQELQTEAQTTDAEMRLKSEEIAFKREELAFKREELALERARLTAEAQRPMQVANA